MTSLTKNTSYVSSLVDFFNDTKPFHSKLTDVIEEYHFFDDLAVRFSEKTNTQIKIGAAWHYQYNSDGDKTRQATFRIKGINSALSSAYNEHVYTVGVHENQDFVGVPFIYSKSTSAGSAPSMVKCLDTNDYYQEGLDYFSSYGGFQFVIKQTRDASSRFIPLWVEKRDENLISTSQSYTRRVANDVTKATSSISVIRTHLQDLLSIHNIPEDAKLEIQRLLAIVSISDSPFVELSSSATNDGVIVPEGLTGFDLIQFIDTRQNEISARTKSLFSVALSVLDKVILPRDYEVALASLQAANIAPPSWAPGGWIGNTKTTNYVSDVLSALTPPLYFRTFTDSQFIESGKSYYPPVTTPYLSISNIKISETAPSGGSWTIVAYDNEYPIYTVFSNVTGYVGSFTAARAGDYFQSADISFFVQYLGQAPIGETCAIKNTNRLVFGPTAPLETWDIIKTNPLAYSRPGLISKRFGYITNLQNVFGKVSINLPNSSRLKSGTIILTCRADKSTFDLTCTSDPAYTGVARVNKTFNDGKIGFVIRAGSAQPFVAGDKFYIEIRNDLAFVQDHDIFYGYDLDSYDNSESVYQREFVTVDKFDAAGFGVEAIEPVIGSAGSSPKIGFLYDTRFTDYDVKKMVISLSENSITNRKWRLVAIPNLRRPMTTLKKDLSTLSEAIDLQEQTLGIAPDPAKNAAPLFSMLGDSNNIPDIRAYYADEFRVEYSDNEFATAGTFAGTVTVNGAYSNTVHGVSFSLPEGSKPFIAVLADDGYDEHGIQNPLVQGGDVIMFTVVNKPPEVLTDIISINSVNAPKMLMHGEGFFDAPAATWSVTFSSATQYTVSAKYTETQIGRAVLGTPIVAKINTPSDSAREGTSFKSDLVHFSIVPPPIGFAAGDTFTFSTYSKKPTYLVHGSASGWMPEATIGEAYWNGTIGFEIQKSKAALFDRSIGSELMPPTSENTWMLNAGSVRLARLRADAPSLTYVFTPVADAVTGWLISRSDKGIIGRVERHGTFKDDYITFVSSVEIADVKKLQLQIIGDDFEMWNNKNAVLIRTPITAMVPRIQQQFLIDKLTADTIGINMTYELVQATRVPNTTGLALEAIDTRRTSLTTGLGQTPITVTSPETAHLRNWIPLSIIPRDSNTSIAESPNNGKFYDVYATGSGEKIGVIAPEGANEMWHTTFTWDAAFFAKYLPLSAFTNFVVYGSSGSNEDMNVKISETLKVMIEPGALSTDYTLTDQVVVKIAEYIHETIITKELDSISANIEDGPFGGFLPGFGNVAYDDEGGVSSYDAGLPLLSHYHEARELAGLDPMTQRQLAMTPGERADRLNLLLQLLGNFLVNNSLVNTSLSAFTANLNADASRLQTTDKFGYPAKGLGIGVTMGRPGIDVDKPSTEGTSVGVQDAFIVVSRDVTQGSTGPTFAIFNIRPNQMVTPSISTFETFSTPLVFSSASATSFIAEFNITAPSAYTATMKTPQIFVWASTWPAPVKATSVSKVGIGKYRVTIASATEVKFYVIPGV